jgi:hypothetical protein
MPDRGAIGLPTHAAPLVDLMVVVTVKRAWLALSARSHDADARAIDG